MRQAHRFSGPGKPYEGLTTIRRGKVDWAGFARLIPKALAEPLSWRKPQRVFVNSMSDLFHESLTNEEIAAVFGVMAACPHLTFQVLTKRPQRAVEWFDWHRGQTVIDGEPWIPIMREVIGYLPEKLAERLHEDGRARDGCPEREPWPLSNVWLGVSVEDQPTADKRIPLLLRCPAAVHFVSAEPLLERVTLDKWLRRGTTIHYSADVSGLLGSLDGLSFIVSENGERLSRFNALSALQGLLARGVKVVPAGDRCDGFSDQTGCPGHDVPRVDWIIVGGESGTGARPCALEWIESVVDQCREASVPVYVKQLGAYCVSEERAYLRTDLTLATDEEAAREGYGSRWLWHAGHPKGDRAGAEWTNWPENLRVREFPR